VSSHADTLQPKTETKFEVKVAVAQATSFDESKYLEKMAEQSGVAAAEVSIVKKEFVIEVGFKFTADTAVTPDDARRAIAKAWNVPMTDVVVTMSRRLEARRMTSTETKVTAKLKTTNAATADLVKAAAADTAGITEKLKTEANITATLSVEKAPAIEVQVETKVTSAQAVEKPDATKLAAIATAAGGTGATVDDTSFQTATVAAKVGTIQSDRDAANAGDIAAFAHSDNVGVLAGVIAILMALRG